MWRSDCSQPVMMMMSLCNNYTGLLESSTSHQFLFTHQNGAQKRLLNKYGDIALLDATYKTTKYSLPLFMLVVRTNVGYLTAAEFICEVDIAESIKKALQIISKRNPEWTPSWTVDYSDAEYQAIQHVFPRPRFICAPFTVSRHGYDGFEMVGLLL